MDKELRNIFIAIGTVFVLALSVTIYSFARLADITEDCKGLKGIVELAWTGEPCPRSDDD
jgi:hypothetical protein